MTRYEAEQHLEDIKKILKTLVQSDDAIELATIKEKARRKLRDFEDVIHFVHNVDD